MQILLLDKAFKNINEFFRYLTNISTEYTNKTIFNICLSIEKLKLLPYIGRYVPNLPDKLFRELIYKEFRIIYFVSEKTILFIFNIFLAVSEI